MTHKYIGYDATSRKRSQQSLPTSQFNQLHDIGFQNIGRETNADNTASSQTLQGLAQAAILAAAANESRSRNQARQVKVRSGATMRNIFDLRAALESVGREEGQPAGLMYDIVDKLNALSISEEQRPAVMEILHAFQEFPDSDWGVPGALVHWLEEPPNSDLAETLSAAAFISRPAPHIAFMLRRQMNAARTHAKAERYSAILQATQESGNMSAEMIYVISDLFPERNN